MNAVYVANHKPKYNYLCDIREMVKKAKAKELPEQLYNLDILDGSPPCSSFSVSGNREKDWGKEKHFREGQSAQILDTLFFDFIELVKELKPKVVIAENVKGLLLGDAKEYAKRVIKDFDDAGYYVVYTLLNASTMGVPQKRERVFFTCIRKDISQGLLVPDGLFDVKPNINMQFNEKPIKLKDFADYKGQKISDGVLKYWEQKNDNDNNIGDVVKRLENRTSMFDLNLVRSNNVCNTIAARVWQNIYFDKPYYLGEHDVKLASTFPQDYNFLDQSVHYICGMSVPPVMMAQISSRVYDFWLSKI